MENHEIVKFKQFVREAIHRVIQQGEPAYNGRHCVYYDSNTGNQCVIGGMLHPDVAMTINKIVTKATKMSIAPTVNTTEVVDVLKKEYPKIAFVDWQVEVLKSLQRIHDHHATMHTGSDFVDNFKQAIANHAFLRDYM